MADRETPSPPRTSSSKEAPSSPTKDLPELEIQKKRQQKRDEKKAAKHGGSEVSRTRVLSAYSRMDVEDPIKQDIRQKVPQLRRASEAFDEGHEKRKRNVSESSVQSICERFATNKKTKMSSDAFEKLFLETVTRRIEARITLTAFHLERREDELQILGDARASGQLEEGDYLEAREAIEGQIKHMQLELIGLKRRKNTIRGTLADRYQELQTYQDVDNTVDRMMDNLLRKFQNPPALSELLPGMTGSREHKQAKFRQSLIEAYGTLPEELEDMPKDHPSHWCAISKQYVQNDYARAAHIVPFAIGETNCKYLFGRKGVQENTGHLMHPRNGLIIHKLLEMAMDDARFVIVPADQEDPSAETLKVVILDKALLNYKDFSGIDWKTLDGRLLEFKTDFRPRLRYLYFNFLTALFRRRRFECTGWKTDVARYSHSKMWGSPGRWLRGSTIRAMARRIGHEVDLESFLGTTDLPLDDNAPEQWDDDLVSDEVYRAFEGRVEEGKEQEEPELSDAEV